MAEKEELWWSECGICGEGVLLSLPEGSTKDEVKVAFAAVGISVLPCRCKKCNQTDGEESDD